MLKDIKPFITKANSNTKKEMLVGKLVENKKSGYCVVYSPASGAAGYRAAMEIAEFIKRASGAIVCVCEDSKADVTKNIISLGKTLQLDKSNIKFDYSKLKDDGFYIRTHNADIFIDGRTHRGLLYGAYDFLERVIGVRFLARDCTYVPSTTEIDLYSMDIIENPSIQNRCYLSKQIMLDSQLLSRMRMVHEFVNIPEEYGGNYALSKVIGNAVHNTLLYVPPSKYYEKFPHWYFVEEGNNTPTDLDYSHTGILPDGSIDDSLEISPVKVAIESLKTFILKSDDKYYMVGQEDVKKCCTCPDCERNAKLYKRSGMNIRFVNAISDGIKEWMVQTGIKRDIMLITFAYQYSQDAPLDEQGNLLDPSVIPRENVLVRIAPIRSDNYFGMLEEGQNKATREMFEKWVKVARKFMVWSYHTKYGDYLMYYPTMRHWQQDLRLYEMMETEYLLMQSDYEEANDWKAQMETYIASKMMWNPNLCANELRAEYIYYYYHHIREYVRQFVDNFDNKFGEFMSLSNPLRPDASLQGLKALLEPSLYGAEFWEKQFAVLDAAESEIRTSDLSSIEKQEYLKRINRLRLTPQYSMAMRFDDYYPDKDKEKQKFLKSFFDNCANLGVTKYAECKPIDELKVLIGYEN